MKNKYTHYIYLYALLGTIVSSGRVMAMMEAYHTEFNVEHETPMSSQHNSGPQGPKPEQITAALQAQDLATQKNKPTNFQQNAIQLRDALSKTGIPNLHIIDNIAQTHTLATPEQGIQIVPPTETNLALHNELQAQSNAASRTSKTSSTASISDSYDFPMRTYSQNGLDASYLLVNDPSHSSPTSSRSKSPTSFDSMNFNPDVTFTNPTQLDLSGDFLSSSSDTSSLSGSTGSTNSSTYSTASAENKFDTSDDIHSVANASANMAQAVQNSMMDMAVHGTGAGRVLAATGKAIGNTVAQVHENLKEYAANAQQSLQDIGNQLYHAPGRLAFQRFNHPDGKIITGKTNSLSSAAKYAYNSLPTIPLFSSKTAPTENRNPVENFTEDGIELLDLEQNKRDRIRASIDAADLNNQITTQSSVHNKPVNSTFNNPAQSFEKSTNAPIKRGDLSINNEYNNDNNNFATLQTDGNAEAFSV